MKNKTLFFTTPAGMMVLLLSLACMLHSCRDAGGELELSPEYVGLDLVLQLPEQISVTTRADATLDGYTIKDVRVFQFPANGGAFSGGDLYKMGYYTSAAAGWATLENGRLKINTGGSDFVDENCSFYIVVNAGDALGSITTKAGLQAAALELANFSTDLTTTEPAVFTYGPVSYTKVAGSTSSPIAMLAKLARMHAKLTVNYTAAQGITVTGARVENIPAALYPFPTAKVTPVPAPTATPATPEYTTVDITPLTANTFSLYLPENLRGTGTATTQSGKNVPANGPGGTLNLCTCVVLQGTYNYYPGEANKEPIGVEYRFYPGADLIRSYNLERGKHYTLDINLTGANSADARVTITDGNVFTIVDPDEVNNDDIKFN